MDIDCKKCGKQNPEVFKYCWFCGDPLPAPPLVEKSCCKSQTYATLVASQDHVTWLAFSLAMTVEVLLATAYSRSNQDNLERYLLITIGIFMSIVFWYIVKKSNRDMSNYYGRAVKDYPEIFDFPPSQRVKGSASIIMELVFAIWLIIWILLLVLFFPGY